MLICLLVISILLVASYVGAATWSEKELPDSISAMVYLLPEKGRWLWIVWIWAATFTLTPILFEVMPDNWQALAHGFATSMLFVGACHFSGHFLTAMRTENQSRMDADLECSGGYRHLHQK